MAELIQRSPESVIEELTARLERLEARVDRLEARPPVAAGERVADEPLPPPGAAPAMPLATLSLVGRTLLVLAGAYLVRALTDGRVLPATAGVAIGLAYAALFQLLADREALRGRHASAVFHDVASSAIAFPLIWEATARFLLIPARAGYVALLAFYALGIGVAWHRRLRANAVVTTLLALVTTGALVVSTHDLLGAMAALLAIAAGVEWLAWRGAWLGLRWAAAIVLDAVAALLVAVAARPAWPEGYPPIALGLVEASLLALPALYVASVAARTLRHGEAVTAFEVVQGSLALVLGLGGAVHVIGAHGEAAAAPGAISLLLGALCYAAAFSVAERRPGQGRNFYLYSTAGGVLTLAGTALLAPGPVRAIAWCAFGLLAAWLGRRHGRMTLRVHAALYLLASALHTGLAVACALSLVGTDGGPLPLVAWVAAAGGVAAWAVLATDRDAPRGGMARTPQLLLAALGALAVAKAIQALAWQAAGPWLAADAGWAAVVRTAVLAALALTLAVGAARLGLAELHWLVYPVVALGGVKLLTQDARIGRPATLVVSLALYGLVLVLLPRLTKARERPAG